LARRLSCSQPFGVPLTGSGETGDLRLRDISLTCAAVNIFLHEIVTRDANPQPGAGFAQPNCSIQRMLIFRNEEPFFNPRGRKKLTPACAVWVVFGEPVVEVGARRADVWIATRPLREEGRWACSTDRLKCRPPTGFYRFAANSRPDHEHCRGQLRSYPGRSAKASAVASTRRL
jgi:hypothetical protein